MKEQIYTIPINEAFERIDGCPLCHMARLTEERCLDYVLGAAMMEPAVRIMTNEQGFCRRHFDDILAVQNRQSIALILQSHLREALSRYLPQTGDLKKAQAASGIGAHSCFLCARAGGIMVHYYENIVYMWHTEPEFRALFNKQPYFCIPHLERLLYYAPRVIRKKHAAGFMHEARALTCAALLGIADDVDALCGIYGYDKPRNITDEQKQSPERAATLLKGG